MLAGCWSLLALAPSPGDVRAPPDGSAGTLEMSPVCAECDIGGSPDGLPELGETGPVGAGWAGWGPSRVVRRQRLAEPAHGGHQPDDALSHLAG